MKMIALAGALCLLFSSSTSCKASPALWCKPGAVMLTSKINKVGILRGSNFAPSRQLATKTRKKKGFGAGLERSMRIEHNGQWTDVPQECLSVFSFGIDEVSLSGDDNGLGIAIIGKPTEKGESLKVTIFKLRDEVSCSQVVRCPNIGDPDNYVRECNRDLR